MEELKNKILIIEDEEDLMEEIKIILQHENFEVLKASNGNEGIKLARQYNPDLILCDILMPDTDGFEVLQELKESSPPVLTPFIFITALAEKKNFRKGMEYGADDYLTKPFTRIELLKAVNSQLKKYSELESYIDQKIKAIEQKVKDKIEALNNEISQQNKTISKFVSDNISLEKQLEENKIEMMNDAFKIIQTNNYLQKIKSTIEKEFQDPVIPPKSRQVLEKLINVFYNKNEKIISNNLTIFQLKFNQVYPNFISNLTKRFLRLTQYEIVFISAHLMGLFTNQLADLFNISSNSVRKSRNRIKNKLGLRKEDDFLIFIHSINQ
jgi:DNA-binding response OmpR family regulator/DNA-binding CsgD family transcriptional regulator